MFSVLLSAQTEFRPGYVVKQNMDTIFGEIDYRSDAIMRDVCRFKNGEKITEYNPNDIKLYRFNEGKYFVSHDSNFLQLLFEGELNVYYLYNSKRERFLLQKGDDEIREVLYDRKIVVKDGVEYLKESTIHYGYLSAFTKEAPELQGQINEMKVLDHKNMVSLAKNYENSINGSKEYITYAEESRKPKFNIELRGGVMYYVDDVDYKDPTNSSSFHFGVLLHTSIPYLGDKWYFKTGVVVSKFEFDSTSNNFYRIPIHMEYIHYKGVIRPRISYGFDFNNTQQLTSLDLGVNIKISEKLFMSIGSEFLYTSNGVIIPNGTYGYTFSGGLFYKL